MQYTHPIVILFRHGQTDYNAERRFQGQLDIPMNDNGKKQSLQTALHLENLFKDLVVSGNSIANCLTSDLQRASSTAAIVAEHLKLKLGITLQFKETSRLREFHAGILQGQTIAEAHALQPEFWALHLQNREKNPYDSAPPGEGAESGNAVAHRLAPLVRALNNQEGNWKTTPPTVGEIQNPGLKNAEIHVWSSHGGAIDCLLTLMNTEFPMQNKKLGNGDLIVMTPLVDYSDHVFASHPLNSRSSEKLTDLPLPGTTFPNEHAKRHGCYVGWKILKYIPVGDNISADIHPTHIV
jgi:broad specificity phosphatase PhoE